MKRLSLAVAAAIAGALTLSATALGAAPPPGAQISDSLRYETRVANSAGIVEGKIDRVLGGRRARRPAPARCGRSGAR